MKIADVEIGKDYIAFDTSTLRVTVDAMLTVPSREALRLRQSVGQLSYPFDSSMRPTTIFQCTVTHRLPYPHEEEIPMPRPILAYLRATDLLRPAT